MRIVCTSDWHGDWVTLGERRHDEVAYAVHRSVDLAVKEKADVYLCLGDVADPDTGGDSFRSAALAIGAAMRLRENGIRSVWITGNHDVCEDGSGCSVLTPLASLSFPEITVTALPRVVWLAEDLALVCLPFAAASHGYDTTEAADLLFEEAITTGAKRIVVAAHLMLSGIHPGSETTEMPRGREILFPAKETKTALLRLNGHYHARQIHDPGDGGPGIYIPGSLARLTFGEEKNEPSLLVIDVPDAAS